MKASTSAISCEAILGEISGSPGCRDPGNYALVSFGDPVSNQPWNRCFEGHHLSLTFTIVPGQGIAATPVFLEANPATVPAVPREVRANVSAGLELSRSIP